MARTVRAPVRARGRSGEPVASAPYRTVPNHLVRPRAGGLLADAAPMTITELPAPDAPAHRRPPGQRPAGTPSAAPRIRRLRGAGEAPHPAGPPVPLGELPLVDPVRGAGAFPAAPAPPADDRCANPRPADGRPRGDHPRDGHPRDDHPRDEVRDDAEAALRLVLEVLDGRRPAAHLAGHLGRDAVRAVRAAGRRGSGPSRLTSVRVSRPAPAAAEVAAVYRLDGRARAVAARFEPPPGADGPWRCVAIRLG